MDWKTSQDEEFQKNYKELRQLLEDALKQVKQAKDYREAKGLLINVQNAFKGLKLSREGREELYARLQDAFGEINQKIAAEKSQFEEEALSNYADFKNRVDEAVYLANNPRNFRETWDHLIEVQSGFKGVKLLREHREELYGRLQIAFDTLKGKQSAEKSAEASESVQNFEGLCDLAEDMLTKASAASDLGSTREELKSLQATIRDAHLVREHRDILNAIIQEAFLTLQIRKDEEIGNNQVVSVETFSRFLPHAKELLQASSATEDFHEIREAIRTLQSEIRNSTLLKEHRENLYTILQDAFAAVNLRQDAKQETFNKESKDNYEKLKRLVEEGFLQAETSTKYKETREFLKKIQADFKLMKLTRDNREELYSRLQTAFNILNKRVDEFFREKKKNWMLKMQYKFSESSSEIYLIQKSLEKDQEYLKELEDKLDIVIFAGKDKEIVSGLQSRIRSTQKAIERKSREIQELEVKINDLHHLIDPEEQTE